MYVLMNLPEWLLDDAIFAIHVNLDTLSFVCATRAANVWL